MTRLTSALAFVAVLVLATGTAVAQPAEHPAPPGGPPPPRPALGKGVRPPLGGPRIKGFEKSGAHLKATRPVKGKVHVAKHGAAHGGGHATHVNWWKVSPPKGEPQPFLAALFNFIVLGLLLGRFGYPPIVQFVKDRHEQIGKDLTEAERLRVEAEARLKEYEAKIANLDHEIATLLQGIKAEGEAERARIIAAAEEQAERLRRDAEGTIAQDMKRARAEIEQEVVTAAMATAEKILRERINETDQRGFVERYLVGLSTAGTTQPPPGGAA